MSTLPQTWNKYAYAFNNPMKLRDGNGLWPTATHESLIDLAFPHLSPFDRGVLKNASSAVDDLMVGGQARSLSYMHGMRAPWQTVGEAQALAANFYTTSINDAIAAKSNGEKSSYFDALYNLGFAMHLVSDMTSPAHRGFQIWNFNPRDIASHMDRESRPPTPEETAMAIAMMRAAYAQVFGQEAADAASGQTTQPDPPNKVPQLTPHGPGADERCFDVSCR